MRCRFEVMAHARRMILQLAKAAIPRRRFAANLERIQQPRRSVVGVVRGPDEPAGRPKPLLFGQAGPIGARRRNGAAPWVLRTRSWRRAVSNQPRSAPDTRENRENARSNRGLALYNCSAWLGNRSGRSHLGNVVLCLRHHSAAAASGDACNGTPAVNVPRNHACFGPLPQFGPHDQPPVLATVAVYTAESGETSQRKADQLAKRFSLPRVESMAPAYDLLLTVTAERLELRFTQVGGPGPLYIDFVGGLLGHTRRVNRFGSLFQAVGFRTGRPTVFDATAGLGRDAFRLAYHGCQVTAVERSTLLFALLRDALDRAALAPDVYARIGNRLCLQHGDARNVLRQLSAGQLQNSSPRVAPDVVYLDPMYPPKKKSALVKIEMRILRQLVGDDLDADELFELASAVACQRVVVKRLRHAEPLAPHPTHSYCDKTTRYDVYIRTQPS